MGYFVIHDISVGSGTSLREFIVALLLCRCDGLLLSILQWFPDNAAAIIMIDNKDILVSSAGLARKMVCKICIGCAQLFLVHNHIGHIIGFGVGRW